MFATVVSVAVMSMIQWKTRTFGGLDENFDDTSLILIG
jgi:hypothetical protein